MSNIVSALGGVSSKFLANISETKPRGMITLRGDLASPKLVAAVREITGVTVPRCGEFSLNDELGAAWMSPDELLILVPYKDTDQSISNLAKLLKGQHYLAVNVSDARSIFSVTGGGAHEVIAKLSPADISPAKISNGQIRRTRLAQVPAAFWFIAKNEIQVMCFKSVAEYVFELLKNAADPKSEIRYF